MAELRSIVTVETIFYIIAYYNNLFFSHKVVFSAHYEEL